MPKRCQITGKGTGTGIKKSHSQIKTKRTVKPNLQTKKLVNPATGKVMKVTLSASALKTLAKWQASGKVYDLKKLIKK